MRLIEEWESAWSDHDMPRITALYAEDCIYEDVTLGTVNNGIEELVQFATSFLTAMPDVAFKVESAIANDKRGAIEWTMTGTHMGHIPSMPAANGGRCNLRGMSAFDLRDGLFARNSDYWDMITFQRQLGHAS